MANIGIVKSEVLANIGIVNKKVLANIGIIDSNRIKGLYFVIIDSRERCY